MDDITDNLTISNLNEALEQSTNFEHVITTCQYSLTRSVDFNSSTKYHQFNLADGKFDTERGGECTFELFEEAVNQLVEALEEEEETLIHCHAGVSRSVSISAAALSTIKEQPVSESISQIKYKRPQANPAGLLKNYAQLYALKHTEQEQKETIPQHIREKHDWE